MLFGPMSGARVTSAYVSWISSKVPTGELPIMLLFSEKAKAPLAPMKAIVVRSHVKVVSILETVTLICVGADSVKRLTLG